MNEWEPRRISHLQAGLAALALFGCVGLAGWQLASRTSSPPAEEPALASAPDEAAEVDSGAGLGGIREPAVAAAPPVDAPTTLGTTLPQAGAVPLLSVDEGVIRWPSAEGNSWVKTPIPTATLVDPDHALAAVRSRRFEASSAAAACGGTAPLNLVELEAEVARREVALLSELEHLLARKEAVMREADEAEAAAAGASVLRAEAEAACAPDNLGPLSLYALAEGEVPPARDALDEAAAIVKNMKPKPAARVVEQWDRSFAAVAMSRIPPRVSAKIFAAMNPEQAADVTEAMLARLAFHQVLP